MVKYINELNNKNNKIKLMLTNTIRKIFIVLLHSVFSVHCIIRISIDSLKHINKSGAKKNEKCVIPKANTPIQKDK